MGIFYTTQRRAIPEIRKAMADALRTDPTKVSDIGQAATDRTAQLQESVSPTFNVFRFVAAAIIAIVLLATAIWTAKDGLNDISSHLMTSFTAYSGIVLGLLGGEAQKNL